MKFKTSHLTLREHILVQKISIGDMTAVAPFLMRRAATTSSSREVYTEDSFLDLETPTIMALLNDACAALPKQVDPLTRVRNLLDFLDNDEDDDEGEEPK